LFNRVEIGQIFIGRREREQASRVDQGPKCLANGRMTRGE
jgi:hypothetical protein